MNALLHFVMTYRMYRKAGHTIRYSLRIAHGCAYRNLPF